MKTWIVKLIAKLFGRKPVPPPRVERAVREYEVTDAGLRPVYREPDRGEWLMSRREAVKFLDDFAISGWRHMGEPPCVIVNGKQMYSESDLFAWLEGSDIVDGERTTRA